MKQSRLAKLALFTVAAVLLSGCVWGGYGGYRGEDRHEGDHGEQHDRDHDRDHGEQGEHGGDR